MNSKWTLLIKKHSILYTWTITRGSESYDSFGWYLLERSAISAARLAIQEMKDREKPKDDNIVYREEV